MRLCDVHALISSTSSPVTVGICKNRSERTGMPGWSHGSWAYLGYDGKTFAEIWYDSAYGPVYGTGDVVGCGTDAQTGNVFFTKNGENLGEFEVYLHINLQELTGLQEPLLPTLEVDFSLS